MSEATWAEISAVSESGQAASVWSVGDEKVMLSKSTSNNAVLLEIIGFNHDNLTNGGKAGITFGTKYAPSVKGYFQMNYQGTNHLGYPASDGFHTINDTFYTDVFPDEVKAVTKDVMKRCYVDGGIVQTTMKVFLFAVEELNTTFSTKVNGEGVPYAAFTNAESRKRQMATGNPPIPSGSNVGWWTRTPTSINDGRWVKIDTNGNTTSDYSTEKNAMCFGFCV